MKKIAMMLGAAALLPLHADTYQFIVSGYPTAKDASDKLYGGRVNIDSSNPANYLSGASASGASRVARGGSWFGVAGNCRPANRYNTTPTTRVASIGIRVVCTAGLR